VGYTPESTVVTSVAEDSLLLGAVTKQRLVKTLQAREDLACSNVSSSVIIICSYDM
jgi:hypothetical protein